MRDKPIIPLCEIIPILPFLSLFSDKNANAFTPFIKLAKPAQFGPRIVISKSFAVCNNSFSSVISSIFPVSPYPLANTTAAFTFFSFPSLSTLDTIFLFTAIIIRSISTGTSNILL